MKRMNQFIGQFIESIAEKGIWKKSVSLLSLCFVVSVVVMATNAPAVNAEKAVGNRSKAEIQPEVVLVGKKITIVRKTSAHVITNTHDRYAVSNETLIVGPDGKQVSYAKMPAPCDVELMYIKGDARHLARRINIIKIAPNADSLMLSERPI